MKLIKYLKRAMINPCKGCLVDPMCKWVCKRFLIYHNTRDNIIGSIIFIILISIVVAFIVTVVHIYYTNTLKRQILLRGDAAVAE